MNAIVGPGNPYGNTMKLSALCQVSPVKQDASGAMSVDMTVRSDDGYCAIPLQNNGKAYASFGVSPTPEHGKVFIYNFSDQTNITYTPTTAYAGSDHFTVNLIEGPGKPRTKIAVNVTADATGVSLPKATPAATSATSTSSVRKKSSRKHVTHRVHSKSKKK
ncbi:hypothetical protein [Entomobacter blattae]|nr:hypothetical protein [Entomobacter blattae]